MKKNIGNFLLIHIIAAAAMLAYVAIPAFFSFNICPLNRFTGLLCPFCGMTRAHIAILKHLDFAEAFFYNKIFFLGIPFLLLAIHYEQLSRRFGLLYKAVIATMVVLFIGYFITRNIIF